MAHSYTEPMARSFALVADIPPSYYSISTYTTGVIDASMARKYIARVMLGNNGLTQGSCVGTWKYCSVSNSSSAFTAIDSVNAAVSFPAGSTAGISKSIEIREEALAKLPVGAARYLRFDLAVAGSSSNQFEVQASVYGGYFRYPPSVGPFSNGSNSYLSTSTSDQIYSLVGGGSQIAVV
jgi:hypothetical protein